MREVVIIAVFFFGFLFLADRYKQPISMRSTAAFLQSSAKAAPNIAASGIAEIKPAAQGVANDFRADTTSKSATTPTVPARPKREVVHHEPEQRCADFGTPDPATGNLKYFCN